MNKRFKFRQISYSAQHFEIFVEIIKMNFKIIYLLSFIYYHLSIIIYLLSFIIYPKYLLLRFFT